MSQLNLTEIDSHNKRVSFNNNTIKDFTIDEIKYERDHQRGKVLEYLLSLCDGSTLDSIEGDVTVQNVTGGYVLGTSYADVTGSVISYKPPAETKTVIYKFGYMIGQQDSHSISHWRFYIDGTEVNYAKSTVSGVDHHQGPRWFEWAINITGTPVTTTDTQNTGIRKYWNESLELKLMARSYSTGNEHKVHVTNHWAGGGTDTFQMPKIHIIAVS